MCRETGRRICKFGQTCARTEREVEEVADQPVALLPDARRMTVDGQHHGVDQTVLAPILAEWFAA